MDIRNFNKNNNNNDNFKGKNINEFMEKAENNDFTFEEQNKFNELKGRYGADIDNLIERFHGMSEGELISEVFRIINEKKRNGTFNSNEIDQLADIISPMLNEEQRQKMRQLVELIK